MAAVRSCKHHSELEQVEAAAAREVEGLKKRGVSDCDKQKLACLEVVTATIKNQLDGQPVCVWEWGGGLGIMCVGVGRGTGLVDNVCGSGEGDRWIMCVGVGRRTGG